MGDEILNNPRIAKEEMLVKSQLQPVKKRKWWIVFKLILFLILLLAGFYLFMHPEGLQNFVNKFFERFGV